MTMDDRVNAVARHGFTERQAGFLVRVMLFGGLCVPRQYATFARTAYGHNVTEFFAKLVDRGHATAHRCLHNRGRLYHVHDRKLYEAVGEPSSRYRRAVPAGRAIERLIRLDAVLAHANVRWLVTDADKVEFVRKQVASLPTERLPHVWVGAGGTRRRRLFPNDVLMATDEEYRPLFVYVVTTPAEDDLRVVFQRYGDLFAALPRWTLRLCFPPHLAYGSGHSHVVCHDELAEPLPPRIVDELRWYFEQLRGLGVARNYPDGLHTPPDSSRLYRAEVQFAAPRFCVLYQRWLNDGEAVFDVVASHGIVEHLADDSGRVRTFRLAVSYRHLSPLVSPERLTRAGVEEGVEGGDTQGDHSSARPQPPFARTDQNDGAHCARDWWRLVEASKQQSDAMICDNERTTRRAAFCAAPLRGRGQYTPGTQT